MYKNALMLAVLTLFTLVGAAQQSLVSNYSEQIGAPLDGHFRVSHIAGTEEAYLTPIHQSSHAANLLQLKNGDILCFWFSGTQEGQSGVAIVVSRLAKNSRQWTVPKTVDRHAGESYQNPVGFQAPDGTVWLFHTTQEAGAGQAHSSVLVVKSHDNGRTWGKSAVLFNEPGAFIRQPLVIMPNGYWLLPMYYSTSRGITTGAESNYSAMKISANQGKTWKECDVPSSGGYVQPSVLYVKHHYVAFFRSRFADYIYRSTSPDGCHWKAPVKTSLPNNNSSIQAVLLRDGKIAMAFNDVSAARVTGKPAVGPRRPLTVALSSDEGLTWSAMRDIEKGHVGQPGSNPLPKVPEREEFSYPAILQQSNGNILVAFTYLRKTIKTMSFPESWIQK